MGARNLPCTVASSFNSHANDRFVVFNKMYTLAGNELSGMSGMLDGTLSIISKDM